MSPIDNPYRNLNGGRWLKGNLHTHTTQSDGVSGPQAVIDDYARRGHGFLMLSDHDVYTSPAEYAKYDARGLLLIPGNEISADGPHLLHVGATGLVPAHADRQQVIDEIAGQGGFAVFNHPNWFADFDHCPQELLERCQGYLGLEIYNGVIGRLPGSPYATNRWDIMLTRGRRVWGFAHDDTHKPTDAGLGWNVAYVREQTPAGVLEALASGRFYGSTGVVITDIQVTDRRIRVQTENASRIVALFDGATRFALGDAACLEVEVPAAAHYVRFECWGTGEAFAWTQPFFAGPD